MNDSLTTRHGIFAIFTSIVGFGIFGIVNMAAAACFTSGWSLILICGAVALIPAICFGTLAMKYNGMTIFEYSRHIFGNTTSYIITALFAIFFLLISGFAISYFAHLLSLWILPQTPFYMICFLLSLIAVVSSLNGLNGTCRTVSLIGLIALIIIIVVRTLMLIFANPINTLPLFDTSQFSGGRSAVIYGMPIFFIGAGIPAILPIKPKKHYALGMATGVAVSVAILCLVFFATVSMLGINQTAMCTDAVVMSMKRIHIPFLNFVQRADIIFIITWSMLILSAVSIFFSVPTTLVGKLFKPKRKWISTCIVGIIVFILSILPSTSQNALYFIKIASIFLGPVCLIIIPVILLIGSVVKRDAKKN